MLAQCPVCKTVQAAQLDDDEEFAWDCITCSEPLVFVTCPKCGSATTVAPKLNFLGRVMCPECKQLSKGPKSGGCIMVFALSLAATGGGAAMASWWMWF